MSADLPGNIRIYEDENKLKITRSWFGGESFIFFIISLTWNSGFLMICLFNDFQVSFPLPLSFILKFLLYLFSALTGLFLIYATAAFFINKTVVDFDSSVFSIVHGPLPWYGNQRIDCSDLKQVFSREHTEARSSNKIPVPAGTVYSVNIFLKNNKVLKVLSDLKKPEDALYIENKIKGKLSLISE